MKAIETLVEDIYELFNLTPIDMDVEEVDKHIDAFGEMLKVHIKDFLYAAGSWLLTAVSHREA